ncbi:alpha/beta fold hydrolase [Mycoplasmopsis agalactiae]|uniref:alpha/beta fold hydrolase n=1 Tax=Mycoplasmopsis agalactiae TaxID=2110 RepID=UPI001F9CD682|nr:alpha/beta hydrolase [Mycoplasmopsis agalactiae]MCE6115332.1 alpha/beta hydrolase [Mycoplasmopsis agalactiae]
MKNVVYDYEVVFKDNNNPNENIVFCHGFNSSPKTFKTFEKYWTKSNYYALQFPGNNNVAPINNHEVSVPQFAKLVVDFVEKNNLKNVTLIGHSMGGGTISLAYKLKPELFKKMVYIAPMNKTSLALADDYRKDYFPKTFDDFLMFLKSLYYDTSTFTSNSEWMKNAKNNFDANDYNNETIVKLGESLPVLELHNQIEQGLDSINAPTILILGEKDGVIRREECIAYFKEHVKNVETVYIPKTGHMMFEENWDEFIKILESFLDK